MVIVFFPSILDKERDIVPHSGFLLAFRLDDGWKRWRVVAICQFQWSCSLPFWVLADKKIKKEMLWRRK